MSFINIFFLFINLSLNLNSQEINSSSNSATNIKPVKIEISTNIATKYLKDLVDIAKTYKDENEKGISKEEKEKRKKIKEEISNILDVKEMANLILKNHWNKLTEKQKKQYIDLMVQMVEKIGYPQIGNYFNGKIEIEYQEEKEIEKNKRLVPVKIIYKEEDLTLNSEFFLHKKGNNWSIYDVKTDGDSLLLIYRNQHMKIIKEKGFPYLIQLLQKKLNS